MRWVGGQVMGWLCEVGRWAGDGVACEVGRWAGDGVAM